MDRGVPRSHQYVESGNIDGGSACGLRCNSSSGEPRQGVLVGDEELFAGPNSGERTIRYPAAEDILTDEIAFLDQPLVNLNNCSGLAEHNIGLLQILCPCDMHFYLYNIQPFARKRAGCAVRLELVLYTQGNTFKVCNRGRLPRTAFLLGFSDASQTQLLANIQELAAELCAGNGCISVAGYKGLVQIVYKCILTFYNYAVVLNKISKHA